MKLKDNSKACVIFTAMVFINAFYLVFSTICTAWGGFKNLFSVYELKNIISLTVIISSIMPGIVLGILIAEAKGRIDKSLNALLVYFVLGIVLSVLLPQFVRTALYKERPASVNILLIFRSIIFSVLAIIGINLIRKGKSTLFFRCVWMITIIWNTIWSISYISNLCEHISSPEIFRMASWGIASNIVSILFNISIYIFINAIDVPEKEYYADSIKMENIAKNVLLSVITLGVYNYVWLYRISKNIKALSRDERSVSGEIICLLFVPFYMLYWIYTRSKTIKQQADIRQISMNDSSAIYLVLSFLGLGIISVALIQNDLNLVIEKICENRE